MNQERNFLTVIKEEFSKRVEEGIITNEQLEKGIYIPFDWIFCEEVNKKTISRQLSYILRENNPNYTKTVDSMGKNPKFVQGIEIIKVKDDLQIKINGKDGQTDVVITDKELPEDFPFPTVTVDNVIEKITNGYEYDRIYNMVGYISKKLGEVGRYNKDEIERIKKKMVRGNGLQELKEHVCPQNERPMREIGVSYAMNKMGKNLGIYYRYLMEEKKLAEKGTDGEQTPEEIQGGLVLMQKSQIKRVNNENKDSKSHKERVSDIYSFEERSEIFKKLEPFKIIKFDTIDEDSQVIPGAYTTFVFRNPNNKNGFLFINEPYDGDKETRAIFLSEEQFSEIIGGQENIDNKLWCDTARDYIEMSRSDFKDDKTGNKYIFRHRSLENYREMMMGVIKGKEPDKSWKRGKESVDRAKKVLYGGEKIVQQSDVKKIAENDVSEQQVKDARNIIFTPKYRDGKAVSIQ